MGGERRNVCWAVFNLGIALISFFCFAPTFTSVKMSSSCPFAFQDCVLFHDTVFHNIHYGNLSKSEQDVYEAAEMAEIHNAIMNRFPAQYKTQVGERGLKLSGMDAYI